MVVLGFNDYRHQTKRLATALGIGYEEIGVHRFPDGESRITLPQNLSEEIIIYRSLEHPNDKLIELLLVCKAARQRGVNRITLVAPYLCYMRQDAEFNPGEVISQKIIGEWLSGLVNRIIAVDPHLHRTHNLSDVFPDIETITLSASPLMAEFLKKRPVPPILLGPDAESEQWVKNIAEASGLEWAVANKIRHSDWQVHVALPIREWRNRHVVIVDDMISTGRTLSTAARQLQQEGVSTINCMTTHALLSEDSEKLITRAGVAHIWSSDSISHNSNTLSLTELLAGALKG